jgi:TPR repeat protein
VLVLAAAGPGAGFARDSAANPDYIKKAKKIKPLAHRGDPRAQTLLGFMYIHGRGVPQYYVGATKWLYRAAAQGDPNAQYQLGLLYDKGHGVLQDWVMAYMWLDLAASGADPRAREYYTRVRDAVASKMTYAQRAEAQWMAYSWRPRPEW